MNKKIAIIGGGLFGTTLYILLKKKGYNCVLFEKNKDLLLGASTNNLNRVHFGRFIEIRTPRPIYVIVNNRAKHDR